MKKVFSVISKLAKVSTPVLIRGESGTGKELVAKAIHYNGPRKDEKFVTINCGAIPENLIESELFGHEKGAFTGATERKLGKFQYASGGTLFLDEIGDISQAMQVKLLRVLQEKQFTPIGSNRVVNVDVRIIAASHKPFEEMIKEGTFREDLFYRLNVLPVYLPPLRERKSDLPHLIGYYIDYFNSVHNLEIKKLNEEATKLLENYDWPGNIRELRNVIEHCFIMESSEVISLDSFPSNITHKAQPSESDDPIKEESQIDFKGIQNSVLDQTDSSEDEKSDREYNFTYGEMNEGKIKLDFQVTKDRFEKRIYYSGFSGE
ncbi:sigma-54 dependent transcriptional regulator [Bacteriovoracaceae bacterium]|nr:sigma-54 dependent transcriptional regulator [Bacteriovoracaceae bacterium]